MVSCHLELSTFCPRDLIWRIFYDTPYVSVFQQEVAGSKPPCDRIEPDNTYRSPPSLVRYLDFGSLA